MTPWTASRIRAAKDRQKLACLTAYDYSTARLVDEAGIELILVGDSLAMTMLGYRNTLPVTVDEMLHHTKAVTRGVRNALVVADLPFLSYEVSSAQAVATAGRFIKEGGAGAVKIEGGTFRAPVVRALLDNGIPVLGHIGLTPQSINKTGGYRVQGKGAADAARLVRDAKALEKAGVFALVIECVPAALGGRITRAVKIPTIGIGAGPKCDGQILVVHDLLGLYSGVSPRFVKRYAALGSTMKKAFETYRREVQEGAFPAAEHSY
ncbi:MAG: 3-methyl-2-oxobutanoate hydroxymethyltransferase [Verrucomicrobiota bacterium]|nr:3-methyl-2-oxobutanoate hydroxymethyltransferase [Verrucomicrobiota bacterium]